jgi:hypothetical protein
MEANMFLKITNRGTVSRKFYELIGASSKRERMSDPNVIGNKGSGAKLAVVPLLRQGLEVAVSSSDSHGDYILRYATQAVDLGGREAHQIMFDYGAGNRFPSQLTLDAFRDWDRPIGQDGMKVFKALREYIANAWDEDKAFTVEFVESITQASKGMSAAYMTATEEVRHILEHLPRYFKFLSAEKPCFASHGGAMFAKSESGATRLFSQGVLVDCKVHHSSVLDYSLDDKHLLSEERVIRDWSEYEQAIGSLWLRVNDATLIRHIMMSIFLGEGGARLELSAVGMIKIPQPIHPQMWHEAWSFIFGQKAIIGVGVVQIDQTARDAGWTVVDNVPHEIRKLLNACGVSNSSDVTPKAPKPAEKPDWEEIELTPEQQGWFGEAYAIFRRYYSEWHYPVRFLRGHGWRWENTGGHCGLGNRHYKEIWITEPSLVSVRNILEILIHEGRHCHTKSGDYDRKFTQDADRQLVEMLLANPIPPRANTWRAVVDAHGIAVPKRLVGQNVHVLVNDTELRLRIGDGAGTATLTCNLAQSIQGHVSHKRRVATFRRLGRVSLPESVRRQLPESLELTIV